MSSRAKNIVIVGAGIVGCSTAYYITRHPRYSQQHTSIIVLEASSVAGGASGKAGGLVAKWAYPSELVKISYTEHERLAKEHGGAQRWGWRYVECGQWVGKGKDLNEESDNLENGEATPMEKPASNGQPDDFDWLYEGATKSYEPMAHSGETAQLHPFYFTTSMLELAQERGAKLVFGKATEILYSSSEPRTVTGVRYTDSSSTSQILPASHIIVAAGPWTPSVVPGVPVSGTRAHSITIRPTRPVPAYALFTEITLPRSLGLGSSASPEIYSRPNNEVYTCSPGDGEPLPETTKDVKVNEQVCDTLFKQVASLSPVLAEGEVTVKQACYLPNVNSGPRGCPIVGEMEDAKGLFLACGHTCWVSIC